MVAIQAAGGYFSAVGGAEAVALQQGQDGSTTLSLRGVATGVLSEPDGNGGFTQEAVQVSLSLLAKQRAGQTAEQVSVAITPSSDPAAVSAAQHQTIKGLNADFVARLAKSQIETDAKAFALLRAESPVDRASATQAAAIESSVTKATAAYQQANQLAGTAADPGQPTSGAATDIQNLVNQALSAGNSGTDGSSTTQDPVAAFADTLVKLLKKYVKLAGSIPTSTETAPAEAAKAAAQNSLQTAANGLQSGSGTEAAVDAASEAYAAADASEAQLYGTGGVSLDASTAAPDGTGSGSTPTAGTGTSQAATVTTEVSIDSSLVPSGSAGAGAAAGGSLSLPPLDPRTALKLARKGEGGDIIGLTARASKAVAGQESPANAA